MVLLLAWLHLHRRPCDVRVPSICLCSSLLLLSCSRRQDEHGLPERPPPVLVNVLGGYQPPG